METRYWLKRNNEGKITRTFRLQVDDDARTIEESVLESDEWKPTTDLMGYLVSGDTRLDEVSEKEAVGATNKTLVSKRVDERRFTLGPMYIPNIEDAHAEWTDPDELQKAVWDYVKTGDRRIRLQHDRDVVAGEWLEIMAWPYEVEAPILMKNMETTTVTFPADTVFLGVRWEPWAWEMVKNGKLRGYSIGGRAERLLADLPVSDVEKSEAAFRDAKYISVAEETVGERDLHATIEAAISEAMKSINPVVNVVMPDEKPRVRRVERDASGSIVRIVEE